MLGRRGYLILNLILFAVMLEDALLFAMAWGYPELWFRIFHHSVPSAMEIAFLRRSAGQWLAFAIGQAITLAVWRKRPVWLAISGGLRFSDFFTDISYIVAVPYLSRAGYLCLLPPPVLNLIFFALLLRAWKSSQPARSL